MRLFVLEGMMIEERIVTEWIDKTSLFWYGIATLILKKVLAFFWR